MSAGWRLTTIISGAQTGADQAGLAAGKFLDYHTGGRCPKDYMTEDGPAPWLSQFGVVPLQTSSLKSRTYANILSCDGVIIFTPTVLSETALKAQDARLAQHASPRQTRLSTSGARDAETFREILRQFHTIYQFTPGSGYTFDLAAAHRKHSLINPRTPEAVREFVYETGITVLNVAGSRESKAPGMFRWVYELLGEGLVPF